MAVPDDHRFIQTVLSHTGVSTDKVSIYMVKFRKSQSRYHKSNIFGFMYQATSHWPLVGKAATLKGPEGTSEMTPVNLYDRLVRFPEVVREFLDEAMELAIVDLLRRTEVDITERLDKKW